MSTPESFAKIYVVILNWNGWTDTIECLESVLRSEYANFHVVVCDNDSSDNSLEKIESWARGELKFTYSGPEELKKYITPGITKPVQYHIAGDFESDGNRADHNLTLIQTGSNLGYAGGNNIGIKYSLQQGDCDYVWLLNNDTIVKPDTLSNMLKHSQKLLDLGVKNTCGSLVCFYDQPETIQALGGGSYNRWTGIGKDSFGRYESIDQDFDHELIASKLNYISGCSWLIPRPYLDDVGYIEEQYFLYYEELDWTIRGLGQYELAYAPDAIVYHKEGSAIGSRGLKTGPSIKSDFYMARSRKRFMQKFYPLRMPIVLFTLLLQACNRLRRKQPRNAVAILRVALGLDKTFDV